MEEKTNFFSAKRITGFAVLLALVVVLQIWGGSIKIGVTSFSLVLIPIVLGGVMFGVSAGAILGFVFGLIVLIYGITGADAFTALLFNEHPFLTSLLCLGKGAAAGAAAGAMFALVRKKNDYAAIFASSAIAPIVNTGLFILGGLLMSDTLSAPAAAGGMTVVYYLVIGCAGLNFIVEFAVNLILSPALYTVFRVTQKNNAKHSAIDSTNQNEKEEQSEK